MKLRTYLQKTSQLAVSNIKKVVLGNQSADYDSILGSIILGYIKFIVFKEMFVPVVDCNREQLKLRFEVIKVFQKHQIDWNALRFKGQVQLDDKEVILYDHNIRQNIKPIEIVDHHFMKDTTCNKTLVGHCGSALTLLYYLLRPNQLPKDSEWQEKYKRYGVARQNQQLDYDREIDELIRVGILLDSYNLSQNQKNRWDLIDKVAVCNIQKRSNSELIRFQELQSTKFDEVLNLKLSLNDHLVKDFKEFSYGKQIIAYSIILMQPKLFLKHYDCQNIKDSILKIMGDKQYCAYFLMFLYQKQSVYRRQLILYCQDEEMLSFLNMVLKEKLKMNSVQSEKGFWHYNDNTNKISRKVLQKEVSVAFEQKRGGQL